MRLDFDATECAFREEVRSFFSDRGPRFPRERVRAGLRPEPNGIIAYQRALAQRGWGAPTWPVEYGGTGWTPTQLYIFESEAARAGAPVQFHQGLELVGPIIFTYGCEEQKARYLPRIISADDWWCQGYSEPGAGSDLASLRTSAVRDGSDYVVTGQKMWTSYAHIASHMFALVRTSVAERRQDGISLLLIDMHSPGIRIQPIRTLDERHHVNEVFLDEVRVPIANCVGEEGKGWTYGKVLLDRERGVAAANALRLSQQLRAIEDAAARARRPGGEPLIRESTFRSRLAQLQIEVIAIEAMVMRLMADAQHGGDSGPRASMLKVRWSELLQQCMQLWLETLGYEAAQFRSLDDSTEFPQDMPFVMEGALYSRVTSIYGGASEIQRNIIARRALGL